MRKPRQGLAIAISVQRKAKAKKKASGGAVASGSKDMNYADGGGVHSGVAQGKIKGVSDAGYTTRAAHEMRKVGAGNPKKSESIVREMHKRKLEELKALPKPKLQGLAEGGNVNAKNERRPMPDNQYDDAEMDRLNDGNKAPKNDSWTSRPDIMQSTKGAKTTRIKHPSMAQSPVFKVRMRDEEDHLEDSDAPASPTEQPPMFDDEMDADKSGPDTPALHTKRMAKGGHVKKDDESMGVHEPYKASVGNSKGLSKMGDETRWAQARAKDMPRSANEHKEHARGEAKRILEEQRLMPKPKLQGLAEGGMINDMMSMEDAEEDNVQHPAGLESDNDQMGDSDAMNDHMEMLADGGKVDGGSEQEEDHSDSIAAAIMARRDRLHDEVDSGAHDLDSAVKMAEGGEVDLDMNAEEQPNDFYHQNQEALKENYDEDMDDMTQPEDSNTRGHRIHSDENDMSDKIRSRMKAKRQFKVR